MENYQNMLRHILDTGTWKENRTGVNTISVFGYQARYDLSKGFPLVTTKKVHWPAVVHELLWLLSGDTNIAYLKENKVKIWNEWADENGDLGPVYGQQWRAWHKPDGEVIDQISWVVDRIKTNPDCRRLLVSAWNPADLPDDSIEPKDNPKLGKAALASCHTFFQFYVSNGKLSCQLYQRSADVFLGVPFNIASYSLLTHMVAQVCGLEVGDFIHTFGDAHIYENHLEQVQEQLSREPYPLPTVKLNPEITNVFDFTYDDIELVNYQSHERIKAKVAV